MLLVEKNERGETTNQWDNSTKSPQEALNSNAEAAFRAHLFVDILVTCFSSIARSLTSSS